MCDGSYCFATASEKLKRTYRKMRLNDEKFRIEKDETVNLTKICDLPHN